MNLLFAGFEYTKLNHVWHIWVINSLRVNFAHKQKPLWLCGVHCWPDCGSPVISLSGASTIGCGSVGCHCCYWRWPRPLNPHKAFGVKFDHLGFEKEIIIFGGTVICNKSSYWLTWVSTVYRTVSTIILTASISFEGRIKCVCVTRSLVCVTASSSLMQSIFMLFSLIFCWITSCNVVTWLPKIAMFVGFEKMANNLCPTDDQFHPVPPPWSSP